jgi:uncharacterized protein YuzE
MGMVWLEVNRNNHIVCVEIRNNDEVLQIISALQQGVKRTADNVRESQGVSGQEAAGHSWLVGAKRRR